MNNWAWYIFCVAKLICFCVVADAVVKALESIAKAIRGKHDCTDD